MKKDLNLYNKNAYHVPRKNKRRIYRNNIVKLLREKIKPSIGSQAEQTRYLPKKSKKKKKPAWEVYGQHCMPNFVDKKLLRLERENSCLRNFIPK